MELLTSLPADLAALADASARGPAPLLRPPETQGAPSNPFALCLALLTGEAPGGEAWPAAGKELPGLPLDLEAEGPAATELVPNPLLAFAPPAFAAGALPTALRLDGVPEPAPPPAAPVVPLPSLPSDVALTPPSLPSGEPPTADALAPQTPTETSLDPLAALAVAGAESTPLEAAVPEAASAAAKSVPAPSWIEAFGNERRLQRPAAATPTELRAAAAPASAATAPFATANQPLAATAVEVPVVVQGAGRRSELAKILASSVPAAESPGASRADWLPSAAVHGAATSAAAAPAASLPGAPVDLRSPNWQEAFAHRVQWLVDTQVGEAHIKLHPPELGAVDVKISLVDDKTYVQLTTATAAARDELAQSLPRLRELFTVSGLELGGASVHNGRDGQQGGQGYQGRGAAAHGSPLASFAPDFAAIPARAPRSSLGRIDVFA